MAGYTVITENLAKVELRQHYKSGNQASIKKIEKIFKELAVHPYFGSGNPKALKYQMSGYWSRMINQKDRLIYRVDDDTVTVYVVSAIGHYDDK